MAEQPMLKFVSVDRDMPTKRDAELRNQDFDEIYAEYAAKKAEEQASRCSQCGVPYCQTHCPLHNNIPDWLRLTAEGRLEEAYALSLLSFGCLDLSRRGWPKFDSILFEHPL